MNLRINRKYIVWLVFCFIFLLRLYKVTNPPLDYSSWRQVDTDSIARNFVEYRFNIFFPQLNYDGPMPNYVQLELQVTTYIIAIIYRTFGYSPAAGRLVPIAFFMGSCLFLYHCVKRKSGPYVALFAVFFYGVLPINVLYSRNIMPESALLFFTLGAIYFFIIYIDSGKSRYCFLSAIFTALAVATKVPAALIGIPMIYLSFKKFKGGAFKNPYLYIFTGVALGLPYIYFRWLGTVAEQNFVSGIGLNMVLPNILNSIVKPENISYLNDQFSSKIFTIPGLLLFFTGFAVRKDREEFYYYLWFGAAVIHVAAIDAVIHLDYYLIFITPIISIFMGYGALKLARNKNLRYILYIAAGVILIYDASYMRDLLKVQQEYINIGSDVRQVTKKDDLIIIGSDSPELLYTCDRKGWRVYGDLITLDNIKKLQGEGAVYLIPYPPKLSQDMKNALDASYSKIVFPDNYFIYNLSGD